LTKRLTEGETMKRIVVLVTLATTLAGAGQAFAYGEFKKEFENKYIKEDPQTEAEKSLKEAYQEASCGVCHTGPKGKDKKVRNTYGKALGELLKKGDKQNVAKIQASLDTVAAQKSDPTDANSPTFGELIAAGKLPGK
jgi:hypothetical protein